MVNFRDHTNPTTGSLFTVTSPVTGTATFLSPSDGSILGSSPVRVGRNELRLPAFTTDLAVAIAP